MNLMSRIKRYRKRHVSLPVLAMLCLIPLAVMLVATVLYVHGALGDISGSVTKNLKQADGRYFHVKELLSKQQPLETILNDLRLRVSQFRGEFEIFILDPDRSDRLLKSLHSEVEGLEKKLSDYSGDFPRELDFRLSESVGVVIDLMDELLDASDYNDRAQLYYDSTQPLNEVLSNVDEFYIRQEEKIKAELSELQRNSETAVTISQRLAQRFRQLDEALLGVVLLFVLANLFCWLLLSRVLSRRLVRLALFADDILLGVAKSPPFVSTDSTGKLAVALAMTGRKLRRLFSELGRQKDAAQRAKDEAEKLAFYDPLTGLANRRLFNQRLDDTFDAVQRHWQKYALLFIDLDNFKHINDSLGHDVGDLLLQRVAEKLRQTVRKADCLARLGGDEFAIITQCSSLGCSQLAQRIIEEFAHPQTICDQSLVVSCSIGIAYVHIDGEDSCSLQKHADLAMYKAKSSGRNNYQFYSEELHALAVHRLQLQSELGKAIEQESFCLHYQAKYKLEGFELAGFEALIRWPLEGGGMLAPDQFIPLAEETGLIEEIGRWVIDQACRDIKELQQCGIYVPVSINVSGRQFYSGGLVREIVVALRKYGIEARWLELEVTETLLIDDIEASVGVLSALQELGINIAIDDFGTGFSSLNYLKNLPIDVLKIDKSFVSSIPGNEKDCAIINAIIELGHQLGLDIVAEGVETSEQMDYLLSMGCEIGQGYLFAKPQPIEQLEVDGSLIYRSEFTD